MDDMISRQAAIETVRKAKSIGQAHRMLVQLPSAQPVNIAKLQPNCNQVASDCISRQAAIKAADSIIERDTSGNNDVVKAMTAWQEYIKALPSAQPEFDKQELIRTITAGITATNTEDVYSCGMRNGMRWCKALLEEEAPKFEKYTQPEQRWIPCKTKFPEKDGSYLVTAYNGQMAIYLFVKGMSENYWKQWGATAWMPLPTPYREGGQE